ncbi:MAG: peptidylprolyl isomerase [Candidatus Micrarchaeia archaeon]|jgi:FKBP-type peptidyl-prolyl cis-trans isomerase 2
MENSKLLGVTLFAVMLSIALAGCTQTGAVIASESVNNTPTGTASAVPTTTASIVPTTTITVSNQTTGDTTMAETVKKGDNIAVDYVGTLEDGTLFDTSVEAEAKKAGMPTRPSYAPLSFTVGAGQMIAGFDAGVVGMKLNETKTVKIAAKDAYGEWTEEAVQAIPTKDLESMLNATAKVGMQLYTQNGMSGKIVSTDANVTKIDFNHALAGKTLIFKITLRKIGN